MKTFHITKYEQAIFECGCKYVVKAETKAEALVKILTGEYEHMDKMDPMLIGYIEPVNSAHITEIIEKQIDDKKEELSDFIAEDLVL